MRGVVQYGIVRMQLPAIWLWRRLRGPSKSVCPGCQSLLRAEEHFMYQPKEKLTCPGLLHDANQLSLQVSRNDKKAA